MEKQKIGIASVNCQTWGELYSPEDALKNGTIFKELNRPFFADHVETSRNEGTLLSKIDQVSFILDDLTLYLDTHADDQNALALYKDYSAKRNELKKEFARTNYPLTRDCVIEGMNTAFSWQDGPIPWEGANI